MDDYTDQQWNDMVDLLTYIAAADRRTVSDFDVRVWLDGASDGEWPSIHAAMRAVRIHRREQPGKWLEPGHVSCILDRVRDQARAEFNRLELNPPKAALDDPDEYARWVKAAAAEHQARALAHFVAGDPSAIKAIRAAS